MPFEVNAVLAMIGWSLLPVALGFLAGRVVLPLLAKGLARRYDRRKEDTLPWTLRKYAFVMGAVLSAYVLTLQLRALDEPFARQLDWATVDIWIKSFATIVGFMAVHRAVHRAIELAPPSLDASARSLLTKISAALIFGIAGVTVLSLFKVDVGPLLASLGVIGIAVALALQDTLGNYFAGITLTIDKPLRPGDYVRMDGGVEGFVESVGWRSTRIKPFSESVIIIPNSKLATSILTNNYYPDNGARVYVDCGVSYASDLAHVEAVCTAVAKEVSGTIEGGDPEFEPLVRYKTFGASNILFTIILRANDFDASFLLKHEYIKALHQRFREEGIEISYPVREIRMSASAARQSSDAANP